MQETGHLALYKIYLFVVIFGITNHLFAQKFPDPKVDSLINLGISNIIDQKYNNAIATFNNLEFEYPELPLAKIYLAACKIAQAYDLAMEYDSDYIESKLEEARIIAEDLIDDDNQNIWNEYYLALAEGYQSYFDAINDNWLSAISTGMNSISAFGECLNIDSTFYEAYIGIGTYEYWMSRKTEFLNGFPFYEDETQIGIDKLQEAINKSSYNSYLAINSLVWIYIDQEKYNEAITVAQKAVEEFPESRYFKWGLARAYEDVDPETSIKIYEKLLESYAAEDSTNHINEIILKHLIAQQHFKIGDLTKSLKLCNDVLSITELTDFELSKLENRIERVKEFRQKLVEMNQ